MSLHNMKNVVPSFDIPCIPCSPDRPVSSKETLGDIDADRMTVPYGSELQIDGLPKIIVNEAGLSLTRAVTKALFSFTGRVVEPTKRFAKRIQVRGLNLELNTPWIRVQVFKTLAEKKASDPLRRTRLRRTSH